MQIKDCSIGDIISIEGLNYRLVSPTTDFSPCLIKVVYSKLDKCYVIEDSFLYCMVWSNECKMIKSHEQENDGK